MTPPHQLLAQAGALPDLRNPVSAPFWAGCAAHELRYQRCRCCQTANFPPTEHCRSCLSSDLIWLIAQGTGEIYSWTVVRRPVTPEFTPPYAPAIVTLAEGYQMLTNIIETDIDTLRVGLPVRVEFRTPKAHFVLPYFTENKEDQL